MHDCIIAFISIECPFLTDVSSIMLGTAVTSWLYSPLVMNCKEGYDGPDDTPPFGKTSLLD